MSLILIVLWYYLCHFFQQIFYNHFESDSVTFYDGSNGQSTQIAKLTENLGSFGISSTGYSMFVKFESDSYSSNNHAGFLATIHYGNPYLNIK